MSGSASLALVDRALVRDARALDELVTRLLPVVQSAVARVLLDQPFPVRNLREEVRDLTQDVFEILWANSGKVLRNWDPRRGSGLEGYVALVATRRARSILRTARRNPWRDLPLEDDELLRLLGSTDPGRRAASRDLLARLDTALHDSLSPTGLTMWQLLFLEERSIDDVRAQTGQTAAAIYQWRRRIGVRAAAILSELDAPEQS